MADLSELKAIILPFPCLWDPQDPYFLDKTVKTVCREQVLEIFNQRSAVPIDMESLKQWIADNLKNSTPTLQTATEKLPATTSQSVPSKVTESTAQEITATEKQPVSPVTTSPQKRPSVKRKVGGNTGHRAQRIPKIQDMVKPFPCLWDRKDLNYRDNIMRKRCLQLLLQKFNRLSTTEITMADLKRKLMALQRRLYRVEIGKSSSSSAISLLANVARNHKTVAPQAMPKFQDLVKPFPCLWDRKDLNYRDNIMRSRCLELLLQKFNSFSSTEITMADLKRKLNALQKRLYRVEIGKSSSSSAISLLANIARNHKTVAPQAMPKFQDMVKPFPCLWDRKDLHYRDKTMRSRCLELLLQKFNSFSSTEITMADLKRKLMSLQTLLYRVEIGKSSSSSAISLLAHVARNQKTVAPQAMPKLQDMVKPFPCLWDRKDLNYRDKTMRSRCLELLLQKFNRLSSTEITTADLKKKLIALQRCLYRVEIGKSSSSSAISLLANIARNQKTVAPQAMPKFQDIVKPFPCLWDRKDLHYRDKTMRSRCLELLLQKFNSFSSTEITTADLKRKLMALQKCLYRVEIGKSLSSSAISLLAHVARNQKTVAPQGMEAKRHEINEIPEGYLGTNGEENEVQETSENFRAPDNPQTDPEASIDSTDTNQKPQDAPDQEEGRCLEVSFNYCRFCGELKISSDTNDIKHYAANNKCTLIINDLRAELEFTDDILPRNVCIDCDRKFQEMVDFVKCVKDAQVKLNRFNNETLDRRQENEDLLAENEKADGQQKKCRIIIDFNSDKLQPLFDNDENNDIEMNNDYEIGSFLEIDTESEQRNESDVPINNNSPSSSLHNENTNSIKSICHRPESATNYITTHAEFLKNKPTNDKIYVNTRRLSKPHHKTTKDFEDDVNSIVITIEDETAAKDINDKQKQLNANDTCDDDRKKIWKQLVMQRARQKAQLNNEM